LMYSSISSQSFVTAPVLSNTWNQSSTPLHHT
jgi:hypothetical protein